MNHCSDPIPLNEACLVATEKLRFDTNNPRLAIQYSVPQGAGDKEFILALKRAADIGELLLSIANNGYVQIEPMIVMGEAPPYRVLEGNRRLAAIKLLQNPTLAEECRVSIPEVRPGMVLNLDHVLAFRVEHEEDARAFIGFKHINGPHKWDALAKAKYAADWFTKGNVSVREISNRIGDSFDTVRKLLYGWFTLEQATRAGVFSIEERYPTRSFPFSHLYVALTRKQVREYLGLDPSFSRADITASPIPEHKLQELGKLCTWLFGNKADSIRPVVASQNPDVKNLANVLANEKALSLLEMKGDLSVAVQSLTPDDLLFQTALYSAESSAKDALANVSSYTGGESLYDSALNLRKIAEHLTRNMKMTRDNEAPQD